jgi:hypothetical protein
MRRLTPLLTLALLSAVILAGCAGGPKKIPPESKLYQRAQDALTVENWRAATASLRSLISTYPFGKYATQGRIDLIYAYYRNDQTDEATKQADDFVKEHPDSPYAAYALFLKGIAYANALRRGPLGFVFHVNLSDRDPLDQQQAYTAFKQLTKRYPHSKYARRPGSWRPLGLHSASRSPSIIATNTWLRSPHTAPVVPPGTDQRPQHQHGHPHREQPLTRDLALLPITAMLAHGGTPSWLVPLSYHRTGEGVATPLSSQVQQNLGHPLNPTHAFI